MRGRTVTCSKCGQTGHNRRSCGTFRTSAPVAPAAPPAPPGRPSVAKLPPLPPSPFLPKTVPNLTAEPAGTVNREEGFTAEQLSAWWLLLHNSFPDLSDETRAQHVTTMSGKTLWAPPPPGGYSPVPSDLLRTFLGSIPPAAVANTSVAEWDAFFSQFPKSVREYAAKPFYISSMKGDTGQQAAALARDPEWEVRWWVAANVTTPTHVLETLLHDPSHSVHGEAIRNPGCTAALLHRVLEEDNDETCREDARAVIADRAAEEAKNERTKDGSG